MIYNLVLFCFFCFLVLLALTVPPYKPVQALTWIAVVILTGLAITYPNAGRGWF